VIVFLVGLNIVGIQESARLNVTLAVVDFATQVLLVLLGFVLIFSPGTLTSNVHFGVAPTWSNFLLAIPVGMIAYTGIETVSNLAEEARDPVRSIPASIRLVAVAVFVIYFTLPMIALSALPVKLVDGSYETKLGLPPEKGGYANDPVLGLVDNLGIHGTPLKVLEYYVSILAATILLIATNAGVIGASRITYAMASYRQLPIVFHRLHRRFKTPHVSLLVFAGAIPILVLLPGKTDFLGTMYAFGAMLSFTIAHAAVVQLRRKHPDKELLFRARPNLRLRGVDWPLFALLGGLGTGLSWLVIVVQDPSTRWAGLAWLAIGFATYAVYRRRVLREPMAVTIRAPVTIGPAAALEYRNILVPVAPGYSSDEAMDVACRLATERRAAIVAVTVVEVPLDAPLGTLLPDEVEEANRQLDEARAIGESYGVRVIARIVRGRNAGRSIVDEARRRNSEIIVMGASRRRRRTQRSAIFGETVDFVLKHSPTRVMVAAGREAA
jgi:APA family basic amino acid/polyamine antiporter